MKKILSLLLVVVMTVSCFTFSACANEVDTYEPPVDIEEYQYFSNCWAGISANGYGFYDVLGGAGSTRSNMHIYVTVSLQKHNSTGTNPWTEVTHWEGDGSNSASAGANRSINVAGTYRAVTTAKIYDQNNTLCETVTAMSNLLVVK